MGIPPPPRSVWSDDPCDPSWKVARGERIIDRISFWGVWPIFGSWIIGRLADRLDLCSAWLESYATPPTGCSGVQPPPQRLIIPSPPRITPPPPITHGEFVIPKKKKVWGKSGTWTEAEINAEIGAVPSRPTIFQHPERWFCAICDRYFPDEQAARSHMHREKQYR